MACQLDTKNHDLWLITWNSFKILRMICHQISVIHGILLCEVEMLWRIYIVLISQENSLVVFKQTSNLADAIILQFVWKNELFSFFIWHGPAIYLDLLCWGGQVALACWAGWFKPDYFGLIWSSLDVGTRMD